MNRITPVTRALTGVLGGLSGLLVILRLAVRGTLPAWAVGLTAPLLALAVVASGFHVGVGLGLVDRARPLFSRHGFWALVVGIVLGFPALGAGGLVDPWETHYAEVAREMLERHDFISPWWANEGWFRSKPVLTFWIEAASMAALGVRTGPDAILSGAGPGMGAPEWAVRLPGWLFMLVGAWLLQRGVARTVSPRAGLLGAIVLATMPGFALLSHQALTDTPLLGAVAASIGLLLGALATSDDVLVGDHRVRLFGRELELHAGHALAAAVAVVTLPQLLILLSAQIHVDASGLHVGADRLVAGSPHACGLPSQPACALERLAHPRLSPVVQAGLWVAPMAWLVARTADERRLSRLLAIGAWLAAALATMAKGPIGLVVPAAAALMHILSTRSLRALRVLEIPTGLALAVTMVAPWYLAAYGRHGRVFLDELVLRNMLGRTLDHLHDTNDGDDTGIVYFVRQLAYATFPWSGVAVAAMFARSPGSSLASLARSPRSSLASLARSPRSSLASLARSPGSSLASLARRTPNVITRDDGHATRDALFGSAMASFMLVSLMRTKFHHYVLVALPPIAMVTGIWLDGVLRQAPRGRRAELTSVAVVLVGSACATALVGRELATGIGPARFILLMTYRYSRLWVSTRSFAPVVAVVTVVTVAALAAAAVPLLRRAALLGFGGASLVLCALLLDRVLPRCGADGGQRGVLATYYQDRAGDNRSPLVAYQLNWKGENFYTGNDVAIFISSGAPMKRYLDERRARNERTVYFLTERGRVLGLETELGRVQSFVEMTGVEVSSEFSLVKVEL
jgi:4-amino-4-deoxy-L-arabinose transferase-like glycosyltransferase